jgi:4-hydroxy-3-polyprenylbenzoate decarboxylase
MGCLLQRLRVAGFETHWVASPAGVLNTHHELGLDRASLERLADHAHNTAKIGVTTASGSFTTQAMVVAPRSRWSTTALSACSP